MYNATDSPYKVVAFAQYKDMHAEDDHAQLAVTLGFAKKSTPRKERVACLIRHIESLKASVGIPKSLGEALEGQVTKAEFEDALDELAENAFDDQCTGTNPRAPLISDLRWLMLDAWDGLDEMKLKDWVVRDT
jgi:acetaldehyde dehydrogenase/alcohol dehydrogenase